MEEITQTINTTTKPPIWDVLSQVDVSPYVEKKDGLTYLPWANAWAAFKSRYPDASYSVKKWNDKPYLYDEDLGYLVETSITVQGETLSMWLPVMDYKNMAMKNKPYTYTVTYDGKTVEKTVKAATMTDINSAIMRCLVKNMSMFGLGNYIYAGEDLPWSLMEAVEEMLGKCSTKNEAKKLYEKYPALKDNKDFRQKVIDRMRQLPD